MTKKGTKRRKNNGQKKYKAGQHIHIGVTKDFTDTATEFFAFCKTYSFNPAEVIRNNIESWLEDQKKLQGQYKTSESYQNEVVAGIVEIYPWLKKALEV